MDAARYRIVFRGELGLGYDPAEVRENICRLTRWEAQRVDRLLESKGCIIKSDLDAATAERMLQALNNTGIICRRERLPDADPAPQSVVETASIAVDVPPAEQNHRAAEGQFRAPAVSTPSSAIPAPPQQIPAPQRLALRRDDPLSVLDRNHPCAFYLGKFLLVIAGAVLVRSLYRHDLTLLLVVLLGAGFALYLGVLAAVTERPFATLFQEHLSLVPSIAPDRERRDEGLPLVTYGLVLLNILLFYAFQLRADPEVLAQSWFFPPLEANSWNVPLSAVAALFFHPGGWALWGSVGFLWMLGSVLEPRIGRGRLVAIYLGSGVVAAVTGLGVQRLLAAESLQLLGAGGALAGLFGAFAIRCHSRSLTVPLPLVGHATSLLPAGCRVRWSSLLVAGLFILADLGAPAAAAGEEGGMLGLWIVLSGLCAGLAIAWQLGLGNEAEDEADEATPGVSVFAAKASTLRRRLEQNPDNAELLLQLARTLSVAELSDEGRACYRRAVVVRLASKPKEATEIYREFTLRYQEAFEPKLTTRLANLYLRQGDLGMVANVLQTLCEDERATPQEREQALFQHATTLAKLNQIDEAHLMLQRFANEFPESPRLPKLRDIIHEAT